MKSLSCVQLFATPWTSAFSVTVSKISPHSCQCSVVFAFFFFFFLIRAILTDVSWYLTAVLVCIPLMTMTDPDHWFLLTFRTSLPLPKAEAYRWVSFSETFCFWVVCRGKERHGELRWGMWTEGLPMVCDLWAHSASAPPGNWAHTVGHWTQPIPMPTFLCSPAALSHPVPGSIPCIGWPKY